MSDKKKFFFNLHDFSDNADDDEGPPPPPTFSEDELAAVKERAYAQGKKDGFEESQQSLEKNIAVLLENAKQSFLEFQSQEQAREKLYEEEASHLAINVFQKIYPSWIKEHGQKEVENAIEAVLKSSAGQQNIIIEVSSQILESVEKRFEDIKNTMSDISITFKGNDDLSENDMRMKWENGGAIRDSEKLAAQILLSLKEDLADTGEKRHNDGIGTENSDE